jgi:hypothetical protein
MCKFRRIHAVICTPNGVVRTDVQEGDFVLSQHDNQDNAVGIGKADGMFVFVLAFQSM